MDSRSSLRSVGNDTLALSFPTRRRRERESKCWSPICLNTYAGIQNLGDMRLRQTLGIKIQVKGKD